MSNENKQSTKEEEKRIQWKPRRSVMTDILKETKKENEEKSKDC